MSLDIAASARKLRQQIRNGEVSGSTSGLAPTMQANLIVLPSRYANDFHNLCQRNPVPCPLLEYTAKGYYVTRLAEDADLRTDIPGYNVFMNGQLIHHAKSDIKEEWTDDHVGFLIGCSYSFETALKVEGYEPTSAKLNKAVPMFITNIPLNPAGVFSGSYVVSMRSYPEKDIPRIREITGRFAKQHGEPIAWGWDDAERIGVKHKLKKGIVDFGDVVEIPEGHVPLFWGCGVTPQVAVIQSNVEGVFMSHLPG